VRGVRITARGVCECEGGGADGELAGGSGQVEASNSDEADEEADKKPDSNADKRPAQKLEEAKTATRAPTAV